MRNRFRHLYVFVQPIGQAEILHKVERMVSMGQTK